MPRLCGHNTRHQERRCLFLQVRLSPLGYLSSPALCPVRKILSDGLPLHIRPQLSDRAAGLPLHDLLSELAEVSLHMLRLLRVRRRAEAEHVDFGDEFLVCLSCADKPWTPLAGCQAVRAKRAAAASTNSSWAAFAASWASVSRCLAAS